ncbi:MAG: type 4a pilus biogenesis protein PilO [Bdellovibrionales bacterium]|nr:type 4a pilus biogenesis protein PilO [Bdellovibrionales bacterium]
MEEKLQNLTFGKALLIGIAIAGTYWLSMYDDGVVKETQIKTIEAEITEQVKEIESINKAIADAERFQQKMNELGAEMERVLLAMPAQLTGLDLMSIISNEAKSVGAEINRINSSDKPNGQNSASDQSTFYEPVLVEVDIAGTYNQMMLFLSNLTRLDKIITTQRIELKLSPDSSPMSPKINMKANLLAYRYLPKSKEAK